MITAGLLVQVLFSTILMYWERERSSASASLLISARISSSIVMLIFSFNGFTYLTSSLSYHKMRHSIGKYDIVGKNTTKYKTMITWIVLWKDQLLLPFAFCFFYFYLFGLPLWLRQNIFCIGLKAACIKRLHGHSRWKVSLKIRIFIYIENR